MLMLDDLPSFRRKVASLRQRRDEAVGEVKQIASRVKSKFKVNTIEKAERLWKKMHKMTMRLAKLYVKERKRIEVEFKDELKNLDFWGNENVDSD